MKKLIIVLLNLTFFIPSLLAGNAPKVKSKTEKITVAAYYFPNYHTNDPRNIINKGEDWSEWELVKAVFIEQFRKLANRYRE